MHFKSVCLFGPGGPWIAMRYLAHSLGARGKASWPGAYRQRKWDGLPSEFAVHALRSPTLGQRQGGSGEGGDLDDRRAYAAGPASGKWK